MVTTTKISALPSGQVINSVTYKVFTANSGSAITIDSANGLLQIITLTANTTITLPAAIASGKEQEITLFLVQDSTGGRTISWVNATYAAGTAPTIASAIGAYTYLGVINSPTIGCTLFQSATNNLSNVLSSAQIFVGSAGNVATGVAMSGDATISNTGAVTIASIGSNGVIPIQGYMPTNYQTGTTYTLVFGDAGKRVSMTNGSASTLTVPTAASVAFLAETEIPIRQGGTGQVTIVAAGGVIINSYNSLLKIAGQYGYVTLKLSSTANTWDLFGNLG